MRNAQEIGNICSYLPATYIINLLENDRETVKMYAYFIP